MRWRIAAFALDYVILAGYILLLVGAGVALNSAAPDPASTLFSNPVVAQGIGFLTLTLPVSLYFALTEASAWQATWGKRRLGLRVVARNGHRLSLARALARTLLKFIPWELAHTAVWHLTLGGATPPAWAPGLLLVVWLLAAVYAFGIWRGPDHRPAYDRLAGTQVVFASQLGS